MNRTVLYIVEHCTASWQSASVETILKEFTDKGWNAPGYHHVIPASGIIHNTFDIDKIANGVAGYNKTSIHYSYIGGIERVDGKIRAVDNRTKEQRDAQNVLRAKYAKMFPNAQFKGHRDFSLDKNGNGIIDSWERIKECPCYDVAEDLRRNGLDNVTLPKELLYEYRKPLIKDMRVLSIQKALNSYGIKNKEGKKITEDKIFGIETRDGIAIFQKINGLPVTGKLDDYTRSKLIGD